MNGSEFMHGARRGLAVAVSAAPFGVLFGAVAVEKGLSAGDAMLMSATIFAGASQLVGVELFQHSVQPWLVVLSVFAVNFRHVLYSAAITRHLGGFSFGQKMLSFFLLTDPQFAEAERRAEATGRLTFVWYLGLGAVVYTAWLATTFLGTVFGRFIGDPKAIGLDVLLPIYFMGLVLGFPQPRQLVAGGGGQFGRLDHRDQAGRLALACQPRRAGRHSGGRSSAAARGRRCR